jgi:uncharacterized membrane protein YphA (DoxX/SURF4 family)
MLATGRMPRLAAATLAVSTIPTTLAGHQFWKVSDPTQAKTQRVQFLKNLNMLGGLMIAAVDTGGRPSVAWRTKRAAKKARKKSGQAAESAKKKLPS